MNHFEESSRSRSTTSLTTMRDSFTPSSTNRRLFHFNDRGEMNPTIKEEQSLIKWNSTLKSNALKSRRNVIKMLFIVVFIYFLSFSPQILFFFLFETHLIKQFPSFFSQSSFIALIMLLLTFNSASNPIVYLIFCSKFRQSFLRMFRRIFSCFPFHSSSNRSSQRTFSLQRLPK